MKRKTNGFLELLTIIVVAISVMVPITFADGTTDLGSGIFKDVKVELNKETLENGSLTEVEITDGLELKVTFDWKLDDSVDLKSGDWAEMQLPASIIGVSGSAATGDLLDSDETVVGSYEVTAEGILRVVFNNELTDKDNRKGEVGLLLKFDVETFKEDIYQTLDFGEPFGKTFNFKANQTGKVHDLEKSGSVNSKINPEYIDWVLDVNTKLDELTDGRVEDVIPDGLELDLSSVEIYELIVGSEGKLTEGNKVTPNVTGTNDVLNVELGNTNKAYRIKYKTNVVDFKEEFTNNATLFDNDEEKAKDDATITGLTKGSRIEKEGWQRTENKDQIYWRIYVNKSEEILENVKVLDTLPKGLVTESIKYWELNKSGDNWNYGSYKGEGNFPLDLGDIDGAYVIEVISNINYGYFENYTKELEFINVVKLEVNGEVVDEDDAKVIITRDPLFDKGGWDMTDYGDTQIQWVITVNEAGHTITDATVTDKIGDGFELIKDSIWVYNEITKEEIELTDDNLIINSDGTITFKLGDITDEITISYYTKVTKINTEGYTNNAELTGGGLGGDGVGEDDLNKEVTVNPHVKNTYKKDAEYHATIGDQFYDGLNYEAKTMSWKLTVDAKKEEITELKITDSFKELGESDELIDAKTMKFIAGSLRVKVIPGEGESDFSILTLGTDYTVVDKGVDGFELEFIGNHKPLKRAKYEIYFKTSFDPNEVISGGGLLSDKYYRINNALFTGKVKDLEGTEKGFSKSDDAEYWLAENYVNRGEKQGALDRENRTISWGIYANAIGLDLTGGPFVISDKLTLGDQTVNKDVRVYKFSLSKDGYPLIKGDEIDSTKYTLEYDDDEKGFTVTFDNGIMVPVLVEFTSKINGISEEWYENTATTKDKNNIEKTYPKKLQYNEHNKFVIKETINADGNSVYTDDELEWNVELNHSLSEVKNAVFEDIMSSGLILLEDSIKVYKGGTSEDKLVDLDSDAINITEEADGTTKLTINLGDLEEIKYYISYVTVVVATEGKISNGASLKGDGELLESIETQEYNAKQASWGTGSGTDRGQIEILKVDEDGNTILLPATFELYYILNGKEQIVTGNEQTTDNGKIQYGNLPYRTYYLRETISPEGYLALEEPIEIIVGKDAKNITLKVENILANKTYAIGDYTWIDSNKDGIQDANEEVLAGVIVELFNEDGERITSTTTDVNGKYIFDELPAGKYKVKFTLTEEQAKLYEFTKQNSGYDSGLDSDADPLTGWTVDIELNDDNTSLTKNYEDQEYNATQGIDPTWDAGVILRERIEISGEKTWDDKDNQDGKRPESITIKLLADGQDFEDNVKIVTEDDDWSWTFSDLYKTNPGSTTDIVYTIVELAVEGYSSEIDGYNVTNSYTPGKTSVQVTKAWDDYSNLYSKRVESITVKLLADGNDTGKTLVLTEANNWTDTFIELDEYKLGKIIEYTVEEIVLDEYNVKIIGNPEEGFVITNILKTYAIGDYTWIDSNKDGIQDANEEVLAGVIVELFNEDGERITSTTTDVNGKYIFDELPAGKYKVKFTLTEEQAKLYEFTKQNSGYDSGLDSDADPLTGWTVDIELNDDNTSLTKNYEDQEYNATQGIDPTWDAGVILRERIEISGEKTWDDKDNQDGKRPESITIKLLADGQDFEDNVKIVTEDDDWSWTFSDLYKTNPGSTTDIVYTIVELAVEGYSSEIDGYNVTNSYTPGKTSVQVTKAWIGKTGQEVIVKLLENGKETGLTLKLNKENNWTGTFTNLDLKSKGKDIVYTIEEVLVLGYHSIIRGNQKEGFIVTNVEKTYAIGDYVWIDSNKDGLQDPNEKPLEGVIVELYDEKGNKVGETRTNSNGRYVFDELSAGKYKVKFTLTEEQAKLYEFTKQHAGDHSKDSNAHTKTGWTIDIVLNDSNVNLTEDYDDVIFIATEGIDPTWDAGVIEKEILSETVKPEKPNDENLIGAGIISLSGLGLGLIALSFVFFALGRKKQKYYN